MPSFALYLPSSIIGLYEIINVWLFAVHCKRDNINFLFVILVNGNERLQEVSSKTAGNKLSLSKIATINAQGKAMLTMFCTTLTLCFKT